MVRLVIIMIVVCSSISYGNKSKKQDIELYRKVPKSLFLIKKAKINSEVGEPILDLRERQLGLVNYDERFDKN